MFHLFIIGLTYSTYIQVPVNEPLCDVIIGIHWVLVYISYCASAEHWFWFYKMTCKCIANGYVQLLHRVTIQSFHCKGWRFWREYSIITIASEWTSAWVLLSVLFKKKILNELEPKCRCRYSSKTEHLPRMVLGHGVHYRRRCHE